MDNVTNYLNEYGAMVVLDQHKFHCWAVVNTVMNFWVQ
jgi:hypothetical protein